MTMGSDVLIELVREQAYSIAKSAMRLGYLQEEVEREMREGLSLGLMDFYYDEKKQRAGH